MVRKCIFQIHSFATNNSPSQEHSWLSSYYLLLFSRSVMSASLRAHHMDCSPSAPSWDFPGQNTRMGCCFLLQGVFSTQGSNSSLLHWQADSLPPSHQGSPLVSHVNCKIPKFLIYSLNIVILKYICKGVNFFITLYQKQVNQLSVNRGRIK